MKTMCNLLDAILEEIGAWGGVLGNDLFKLCNFSISGGI